MSLSKKAFPSVSGDINILLLGQTGVGKTTFINAFANYLLYNSLDEAIQGPLQVIIPAWFTFMDRDTFDERTIVIGTPDESERTGTVGQSCTKQCRGFVFRIGNRNLRLIDAPGIGDTQGVLQDEKNFEDILAYIAQLEYLNGICILLRPNEERLHVLFRFCVKELLRHLHVHAKENIMFIFTNARSTTYELGSSAPLLKKLLLDLKAYSEKEVPFSRDNAFLFDNEAFRFLALCKNGITVASQDTSVYSRSWDHSIQEFSRLLSRILKCDKHATRDTLSLNEAQQLIRKLSRPIGEIATLIQENIQLALKHKNDVYTNSTATPAILPQNDARVVELGHSRTVCTVDKCIEVITVDGQQKVNYASRCHQHCFLDGIERDVIGHEKLKDCAAIDKETFNCIECGCHWQKHMHVTYEFQKFLTDVSLNTSNDSVSLVTVIDQRIQDLRTEQDEITKVCSQLTEFLRVNALNPVNDDILEYIQLFIREEEIKKNAGAENDGVLAGLRKLSDDYKREIDLVQQTMKISRTSLVPTSADPVNSVQREDIFLLVGTLYHLPINGAKIRAQVNELKRVQQKFILNREQSVHLPSEASSSSVMADLMGIFA